MLYKFKLLTKEHRIVMPLKSVSLKNSKMHRELRNSYDLVEIYKRILGCEMCMM